MPKYKLTVAYEGTHYSGWQVQPDSPSIQETIQNALATFLREAVHVTGSGRTDAGAHALGQVAHFSSVQELDLGLFLSAANGLLPKDIRILNIEPVEDDFHARYSAKGKIYHYHLHTDKVMSPFKRDTSLHVKPPFNRAAFEAAIPHFVGTHDFTSVANEPLKGSVAKNPVRTIYRIDLVEEEGGIRLEFEGNGFLYKMVRNIVGTLLEVAHEKIPPEDVLKILEAKDRRKAGRAAAAKGLFLVRVKY